MQRRSGLCQRQTEEVNGVVAADLLPGFVGQTSGIVEPIKPQFDLEIGISGTVAAICSEKEFVLKLDQEFYGKVLIVFKIKKLDLQP